MNKNSTIFIAGGTGLVGSAIIKNLIHKGYTNIISNYNQREVFIDGANYYPLDLTKQQNVEFFFETFKPEYVFVAAAKVGGIVANNTYRAEFIFSNLVIQNNLIDISYKNNVKKLVFLGSTCIYPKNCPQPMKEEYLLTDTLEYTNEPYAIAKIAGIKMCESYNIQYGTNFISVMPTNLYGPNDNFDLEKSHVLPAMIRKIYLAKLLGENNIQAVLHDLKMDNIQTAQEYLKAFGVSGERVEIWGSGQPMREFLWSEDMADACVYLMEKRDFKDTYSTSSEIRNTHINLGTGIEISIRDLAYLIREIVGYTGDIYFNTDKPDGTMRKLTDVSKLHALGWKHTVELREGIERIYAWYLAQ
ncbi:MAG: GDP-L-fucose synthase [Sulfuricurvum sp.]|jgi:GDP-L-fucose synthase